MNSRLNDIKKNNKKYKAVVIGVSAGGVDALSTILPSIPLHCSYAVIIVQHMHPDSGGYLSIILDKQCPLKVKEADEKEIIKPGIVYIAPPNYHLLIENDMTFSFSIEGPVNFSRPSIDVLFECAAEAYSKSLVGIVLTGANKDGSCGLKKIKEMGGIAVVQDPLTAEAESMPKAAIKATQVDYILPLDQIGPFLKNLSC
ncbi:MAG: chemotaxis protein CheB [Candidatus Anammoxibacter sp.]